MEKTNLDILKSKISKLDINEQKLRDLYLRDIALGKIQGSMTGYASIDKPWLKHYAEAAINYNVPTTSFYEYFKECSENYLDEVAIMFFGRKILYRQVRKEIEKVSKSLLALEIKKNDRVMLLEAATPESVYLLYALNNIGAISVPIDPRVNSKQLKGLIDENHPKLIVTLDLCNDLVYQVNNEENCKVVSVSAVESAPKIVKILNNVMNGKNNSKLYGFITWNDFINNGVNCDYKIDQTISPYDIASIIYTGGTTGAKKGVQLTNQNFNSIAFYHQICGIPHHAGQKLLDFMPPFIAYGVVDGMHMPLCVGWTIDMKPKFEFKDFPKEVLKGKYNILMASPVHYEYMYNYKTTKDLSFIDMIISGGDSMSMEFENKFNEYLAKHKCSAIMGQGIGMTEASSVMTLPYPGKIKTGSLGFPFSITNFGVFDPDTDEELGYDKKGELCFQGTSIMHGYLNHADDEKRVLKKHSDGKIWLHTGDIGYIDKDGYVYIIGRIKRIINRNGLKVYPSEIEKIALSHDNVKDAIAVGVSNDDERNVPILHLILHDKNNVEKTECEILEMIKNRLYEEFIPYGIKVRDSYPYTGNGKIDYISLSNEEYNGVDYTKQLVLKMKKNK